MGTPIIGEMLRQSLEAAEVADYLQTIATNVRAGNLLGFELKWDAGTEWIDSKILPRQPVDFIKLNVVVDNPVKE